LSKQLIDAAKAAGVEITLGEANRAANPDGKRYWTETARVALGG
jgi:hypothetical protein